MIRRPCQCLVEMTQIAGVWPPCLARRGHGRTADLMTADGLQQSIRRKRHVAVVAGAAGRPCGVSGVRSEIRSIGGVAPKAGFIAVHVFPELIVSPLPDRAHIV